MYNRLVYSSFFLLISALASGQTGLTVGNDKDSHGCIGSAGYTFSVLKNDCIRVFEQKVQLKEMHPTGSYTSMAAVVFSKNNKKAEVFMAGTPSGILMSRVGKAGKYSWRSGDLTLRKGTGYVLKRGKTVLFSS
ncbi:hypothetical protein [Spirosoma aerophilum]